MCSSHCWLTGFAWEMFRFVASSLVALFFTEPESEVTAFTASAYATLASKTHVAANISLITPNRRRATASKQLYNVRVRASSPAGFLTSSQTLSYDPEFRVRASSPAGFWTSSQTDPVAAKVSLMRRRATAPLSQLTLTATLPQTLAASTLELRSEIQPFRRSSVSDALAELHITPALGCRAESCSTLTGPEVFGVLTFGEGFVWRLGCWGLHINLAGRGLHYGPATAPEPLALLGFAHAPVRQVLAVAARPASEGRAGPGPLAASALLDVLTFVPGSRPCIPTAASTSPPLLDDMLAL